MSEHTYLTPEALSIIGSCIPTGPSAIAVHWIIADLDAVRDELKAAQEENRKNLELWDADAKDKDEEIARLRQCAKYESDVAAQAVTELNRMRTALEEFLAVVDDSDGIAGYHLNGAIAKWDEFDFVDQLRALNPQPAQPALPALARQMWPLLNRERGVLISRQVDGSITEEEARRLHDLQDFTDRWVEAVAPRVEINLQPPQPEKQQEG